MAASPLAALQASLQRRIAHSSMLAKARLAIFQPRGPEAGDVFLNQRRVFVLPTRPGLALVLLLVALLLGSINYSLSLGFALTFLIAGVAWVGMFYTFRNLAHLTLRPGRVDAVFAGQLAEFQLVLVNNHRYDRFTIELNADDQYLPTRCDAMAKATATAIVPVKAAKRGWQQMPRVTLATTFPLGLWRSWSYWQPDLRALVYPEPAPSGQPLPLSEGDGQDGQSHGGPGSEDYAGIRPYAAGDVIRHLAWKAMARSPGDEVLTKVFSGASQRELWLDLAQAGGHLESGLSLMTRWVLDCEAGDASYGLRLPGLELAPARGEAHRDQCLMALALYRSEP
jgi:uncharacterized protein (DUF58 family)